MRMAPISYLNRVSSLDCVNAESRARIYNKFARVVVLRYVTCLRNARRCTKYRSWLTQKLTERFEFSRIFKARAIFEQPQDCR